MRRASCGIVPYIYIYIYTSCIVCTRWHKADGVQLMVMAHGLRRMGHCTGEGIHRGAEEVRRCLARWVVGGREDEFALHPSSPLVISHHLTSSLYVSLFSLHLSTSLYISLRLSTSLHVARDGRRVRGAWWWRESLACVTHHHPSYYEAWGVVGVWWWG